MATVAFIPHEILEKILRVLPLRDKINSGLVCAHWNEVVGCNLSHVTIDASVPYGGRWVEENMRWVGTSYEESVHYDNEYELREDEMKVWYRNENDPADKEMKVLISKLCRITNNIKTLDIQDYQLNTDCLAELFSRQRGLQILRIHANLPASDKDDYFETIVQGIIKHQETIEAIEIQIVTSFIHVEISQYIACKESLCFPKLKSLSLSPEATNALKDLNKDIFHALVESNHLEEISLYYLNPPVSHFIKNGSLRFLKKFELTRFNFGIDAEQAEQLIKCCPNIIHFDGCSDSLDKTKYVHAMIQIISTFGSQLKHFGCDIYCREIIDAILEKCKSLESLSLTFSYSLGEDEVAVVKNLIPVLGCLEKLTKLSLWLQSTEVDAEAVCGLIERCGTNLTVLTVQFTGIESFKILNAVGACCKNLVKLRLMIEDRLRIEGEGDPLRTRQLKESGQAILEGCQKLTSFHLDVCKHTSWATRVEHVFFDHIGNKLPHLKELTFSNIAEYPQSDLIKLIEELPYCRIGNFF